MIKEKIRDIELVFEVYNDCFSPKNIVRNPVLLHYILKDKLSSLTKLQKNKAALGGLLIHLRLFLVKQAFLCPLGREMPVV